MSTDVSPDKISQTINELEVLCRDSGWQFPNGERVLAWNVPRTTGEFLYKMVLERKPKHILELGTSVGYSVLWLGKAAFEVGAHIDTVEYFDQKVSIAREYIRRAGLTDIVTVHHVRILDFLGNTNNAYDMVFMDADKTNYKRYFELLRNRVAKNCILVVDNAINFQSRMQDFIDTCMNDRTVSTRTVPIDNGLFIVEFL